MYSLSEDIREREREKSSQFFKVGGEEECQDHARDGDQWVRFSSYIKRDKKASYLGEDSFLEQVDFETTVMKGEDLCWRTRVPVVNEARKDRGGWGAVLQ